MALNIPPIPPLPPDIKTDPKRLVEYLESLVRTLNQSFDEIRRALKGST